MSRFYIKETDILNFVLEELNKNSLGIMFSMGNWGFTDDKGKVFLVNRMALNNDRFDIIDQFDENTYQETKESFVAVSIPLNYGEILALPTDEVKDIVFDTRVEFLVVAENITTQKIITLAIEEIRAKLIQYLTTYQVSYHKFDAVDADDRDYETLKINTMSGVIDYGELFQINGINYLQYSMPLTMRITNKGEFANQETTTISVDNYFDETVLDMIEWSYAEQTSSEGTQLLNDFNITEESNSLEVKSIPNSKGWAFSFDIQLDAKVPILRHWYSLARKRMLGYHVYNLKNTFKEWTSKTIDDNEVFGWYDADDLTIDVPCIMTNCSFTDSLSKGEKITLSITLVPFYVSEG